jgi:hypothetical protein
VNGQHTVRIGGASGFWGDSPQAGRQLLDAGVNYIIFDYLAEVTMAILARARAKDPARGYATDFVRPVMAGLMRDLCERRVRVVANAGGMNPRGCRDALAKAAAELGLSPKIAVVEGDELMGSADAMRAAGLKEIDRGTSFPDKPWSVNAYLGALPIAKALAEGADIVITGRCVDSALTLGPLIAEFGWAADDYDRLAAGSLAGHVIECGCQATGGNFTDWREVSGWDNMGFPIAECSADGSFVIGKPDDTGGLVTPLSVGEQVVYELGDPSRYLLPDVACDFTGVHLQQAGPDRVRVSGARGHAPGEKYKVSTTYQEGFRCTAMFTLCGRDAAAKAQRVGEAILARTRRLFREAGFGDYRRTSLKLLGTEHQYGPLANAQLAASREVVMRLDVHHNESGALELFAQEIAPAGLAMAPGRCGMFGGRPTVSPVVGHAAFLWDKSKVPVQVELEGQTHVVAMPCGSSQPQERAAIRETRGAAARGKTVRASLFDLACARSGDKGDNVNIGVIARSPQALEVLREQLTAERVRSHFAHLVLGDVTRYEMPGMGAFNFVLTQALDGGGTRSLRNDPQGKTFAQMLLDMELDVPVANS